MGKIAEQYLVSQITDLNAQIIELEKKLSETRKIVETQDNYIRDLEIANDFLTGQFEKKEHSICAYAFEKSEDYAQLMELCGFAEEEEGEE